MPAGAQRILDGLMDLAGQIEATGQQVRACLRTTSILLHRPTFRVCDGVSQYIVSGGRYDGLLFDLMAHRCQSVGMAFNIDVLTDVLMQGESNIQDNGKLRIALTKGALKRILFHLESCGIDANHYATARKLIIPLGGFGRSYLSEGPDVTTYLNNGVVDLGIVGSDVPMNKTIHLMKCLKTANASLSWPP